MPDTPNEAPPDIFRDFLPHTKHYPGIELTCADGTKIKPRAVLRIDPSNPTQDFVTHPHWQAVVAYQTAMAGIDLQQEEQRHERMEAELFIEFRNIRPDNKPPSVEMIKAKIASDPKVASSWEKVFELKRRYEAWKALNAAMLSRRDCLIQAGADVRLDRRSAI